MRLELLEVRIGIKSLGRGGIVEANTSYRKKMPGGCWQLNPDTKVCVTMDLSFQPQKQKEFSIPYQENFTKQFPPLGPIINYQK